MTKLATSFEKTKNERVDLLSKLASTQRCGNNCSIIHEKISKPMVEDLSRCCVETRKTWMDMLFEYFRKDEASKYTLVGDNLYRRGFSFPLLRCLDTKEVEYVMSIWIPYRRLSFGKQDRHGWILLSSTKRYQQFVDIHKASLESLHLVISPWPFHK
ncbi:hypothetical protein CR513_05061, partial [Mucuna pruriens]